jgi:predicted O-methyltransferase YrrM
MDFIFIDGGHSFETIQSDWDNVKHRMHDETVVVFDDYWTGPALTDPVYSQGGCQRLIDSLTGYQVEILEPTDKFKRIWSNMVKVTK